MEEKEQKLPNGKVINTLLWDQENLLKAVKEVSHFSEEGKSVIMISSELPEVLGMCDRIYVMNEGKMTGELSAKEASQEAIMSCIIQSASKGA